ncbi:MAG: protease, partial [Archaeoglobaceae archaeon]
MFLIFDPLYMLLAVLGYLIMFALASTVAPKLANRISGRFSLHVSMLLLAILILGISAATIYAILYLSG